MTMIHHEQNIFYCDFLAERGVDLKGPRQKVAIAEIEAAYRNVQAAWQWAVENRQISHLPQALDTLGLFYLWKSRLAEGAAICRLAVEQVPSDPQRIQTLPSQPSLALFAIHTHIWLSIFQRSLKQRVSAQQALHQAEEWLSHPCLVDSDTRPMQALLLLEKTELTYESNRQQSRELAEQSLALYRTLDDPWHLAQALDLVGRAYQSLGMLDRARELMEEGLTLRQTLGDTRGIAESLKNLSHLARWMGRFEEAEALIHQAIAIFTDLNDQGQHARAIHTLIGILVYGGKFTESLQLFTESGAQTIVAAFARMHLGHYEEARQRFQSTLSHYPKTASGYAVKNLGRVALVNGDYAEAQTLLLEALDLFRYAEDMNGVGQTLGCLGIVALRLDNLQQAQTYILENLQLAADTLIILPSMTALTSLALLRAKEGDHVAALELYTVALQNGHVANSRWYHDVVGQYIDAVAERLPDNIVAAVEARGRSQDWRSTVPHLLLAWDKLSPSTVA